MLKINDRLTEARHKDGIVRNAILATLPPAAFDQLRPFLKVVDLKRNAVIHEANKPVESVYFIESGVISRVARTQEDGSVEVAMVGRYGLVGISVLLGTMTALHRTVVQIPGQALRISASDLRSVMQADPTVRDHLLRYVHLLMTLKGQVSLCNAKHDIGQRLARWLMLAHERVDGDELPVTHDLLATMLGVRRPGVSEALAGLETSGIVSKSRGVLKIVDADALKAQACECHKIIGDRFASQRMMQHYEHRLDAA
jgi:CRP-like cAMP-binding protein